jgi:acetyl-CoA C-acetyltransferase
MPVNPSGGVVSTNAIGASAMVRVAEASLQVMGLAEGGHQVPRRVKNAVAHGWGGLFQFVTITILGDEPVKR